MPQLDLADFPIPAENLRARLNAWRFRPDVALRIYMDSDFLSELVHLYALVERLDKFEAQVRVEAQMSTTPAQ